MFSTLNTGLATMAKYVYTIYVRVYFCTPRLIEVGRCYGMKMNVEKAKVMRISR
jgi:hypothetical protein